MKIVRMVRYLPPESQMMPGQHQGILALSHAQARAGHEVTLVAVKSPRYAPWRDAEVRMRRVLGFGPHAFQFDSLSFCVSGMVEVLRRARRGEVDVLHIHDIDAAWVSWVRGLGVPLAAHCHAFRRSWIGAGVLREWTRTWGSLRSAYYHADAGMVFFLENRYLRGAGVIFAVSDSLKQDLVRFAGIPPEKICVAYNGVDTDRFRPLPPLPSLPPGPRILIAAGGGAYPRKGLFQFLEVARIFQREGWPGSFLVPGNVADAFRRHTGPNVHFMGFVPHGEMPRLYSSCDVYFHPALYESFGKSVAEAMACGKPVLAARVGGIPEVVGPEAGLLLPPGPTEEMARVLRDLLGDPERRRWMGEAGRRRILERFTWERAAERVEEGYRRWLCGKP